jgi:phosphoglycerate dehydrogenase-like enzyme/glyoxylase-like metal-dependent hydrolase (beta-lactamase superfamily II)
LSFRGVVARGGVIAWLLPTRNDERPPIRHADFVCRSPPSPLSSEEDTPNLSEVEPAMRFLLSLTLLAIPSFAVAQEKMKFDEVKEVAPGVFFRYSSISATDKSIPFGGCNNIWFVMDDYVVVFDANFPKEAGDVIAAVKKTTDKPIRYVLDSHHHGDHAYGNEVWAKAGATIVSQALCAQWLRDKGAAEWDEASKGPNGRKDLTTSKVRVPDLTFDDKLVFDDGHHRVEFHFLGHAHTPGDAVAWVPAHKILCTGDACVNGAFNFMGHSDSASWIRVLDRMAAFEPKIVCPGHGLPMGPELLKTQQRYFVDLRAQVQRGIDKKLDFDDIVRQMDMPWQTEWTGLDIKERKDNIQYVYDELTGRVAPWDLFEQYGLYAGNSPTKKDAGWTAPKKIVVPALMPARLMDLKRIAPEVSFIPVATAAEAAKEAAGADAIVGFCSADIVKANPKIRWIQISHAGVEKELVPEVVKSSAVVTNMARVYGPNVADQGFALLLSLTRPNVFGPTATRDLKSFLGEDGKLSDAAFSKKFPAHELDGKTMVIVGLGGIGTQAARRAHAFGMQVQAVDPNDKIERPSFVERIHRPDQMMDLLPKADVVFVCCPLTDKTRGMFGSEQFSKMKKSALFINVGRGGLVKTEALVGALKSGEIAGAGLDVTDPEPFPMNHPLRELKNVALSPHQGGQSEGGRDRQWRLFRENIRRFVAGEPLLCVVDKQKGY